MHRPTRKLVLGGLVALGLAAGGCLFALAQVNQITPTTMTGNEVMVMSYGPGGPSTFVTMNMVRNGMANAVLASVAGSFTIGTGATAAVALGGDVIVTAQPSAATITLPPNPISDGTIVRVCNSSAAAWATNVVTLAANTSQTLATSAALTAQAQGTCAAVQWNLANATWYRIQ